MKHRARQFNLDMPGETFVLAGQQDRAPLCEHCNRAGFLVAGLCEPCTLAREIGERDAENAHRDFFKD